MWNLILFTLVSCLSFSLARLGPELESLKGLAIQEIQREVLQGLKLDNPKIKANGCKCNKDNGPQCSCCAHIQVEKLNDTACIKAIYLPNQIGISVLFTWDGEVKFNETISVANPPPLCVNIPHLKKLAKLCVKFTELNWNKTFSGCISLEAKIPFVKSEDYKIGCFNIPLAKTGFSHETIDYANMRKQQVQDAENVDRKEKAAHKEDIERLVNSLGLLGKSASSFAENAPKIKTVPMDKHTTESRQTRMINSLGLMTRTASDFLQHTRSEVKGQGSKAKKSVLTKSKEIEMIKSLGLMQRTAADFLQHGSDKQEQRPAKKASKLTKSEQIKMIQSLGLLGKTYNKDGRLANTVIMN